MCIVNFDLFSSREYYLAYHVLTKFRFSHEDVYGLFEKNSLRNPIDEYGCLLVEFY